MSSALLADIDLNLLVALDALLEERSVTRAARRVGVTQSAMSRSLGRLRELLGDPLVVRSGRELLLTPRAEAVAAPLRAALGEIHRVVRDRSDFEPATARRRFVLSASDYGSALVLPGLVELVLAEAPGIELTVRPRVDDMVRQLESGEIDLAIGIQTDLPAELHAQKLFTEKYVCAAREGHPALRRGKLSLAEYSGLAHVVVAPRGRSGGAVDDLLAAHGVRRRVALRVPRYLEAVWIASRTDLVLTIPEVLARAFAGPLKLSVVDPPLASPELSVRQFWHARLHHDAGHRWLRERLVKIAKRV